ncbi:cryptochrome/photolyase family protein [Kutzneria kofuensis]|uniref:Deoxyribodipyrimidine photo-lyase n=1 Tax=Kutzneria kofuensis TaxID=103725 RepID=A0A7W9NG13_9PSEU|nr:deoxyribodipyrimidine photo-lyase [Kutzneria kofuensis]MBB5892057.1 deoxyribodipyrimidine photo-lyase [Kutzneria kofuensis]
MSPPAIMWFRRDLRLSDHPALLAAADSGEVLPLFVLDDRLLKPAGEPRRRFLYDCLRALDHDLGGRLHVARGDPERVLPEIAKKIEAGSVHVSADAGPYGRERDERVRKALGNIDFVRTGSPYAVTPGRVRKQDGEPYRVFTPFRTAWLDHGWRKPAQSGVDSARWMSLKGGEKIPAGKSKHHAGEEAALEAWQDFRDGVLADYDTDRDRPDRNGTSRLSAYLHWGCLHPRTLLADIRPGNETFRSELAWREFYADVLWHQPNTARENYDRKFDRFEHDTGQAARERFEAWCAGRTGYPIVDAGMRQLLAEDWMHNRVRMIVASFLVKDLHVPWWWGARHFMRHLVDGDLASNQLNWQWVAGCGTDAAPYFRIFNPVTQGEKFDAGGDYVRKYVPELRGVQGKAVHKLDKLPKDYPAPIVDHAHERRVSLDRYDAIRTT